MVARQVFGERRPYIGRSAEDIRTGARTLNLLHEADWYGEEDIASGTLFAGLAVPGYLTLR